MTVGLGGPLPLGEITPDGCPLCGASLLGDPIPEASRHLFGSSTHFRREIGMEPDGYDGVLYWVCPDCHGAWSQFTNTRLAQGAGPDRLTRLGDEAVATHDAQVALLAEAAKVEDIMATHGAQVAVTLAVAGLTWTGWVVDPRTGAWLYLLVDTTGFDFSGSRWEQARDLASDITSLPVVLIANRGAQGAKLAEQAHTPPRSVQT